MVVALRTRATADHDGWVWLLPPPEKAAYDRAMLAGRIIQAQRRSDAGVEVVARLARRPPGRGFGRLH